MIDPTPEAPQQHRNSTARTPRQLGSNTVRCGAGASLVLPALPNLLTNFFASKAAGAQIDCQQFTSSHPEPCIQGSDAYVTWASYSSFVSQVLIAFPLVPLFGSWSDSFGRKPFLVIGQLSNVLPYLVVLLHATPAVQLSLYLYYPCSMLSDGVTPLTAALASVADVMPQQFRAFGFGVFYASMAASFAVMPLLGTWLGLKHALQLGIALKLISIVYTLVRPLPPHAFAPLATALQIDQPALRLVQTSVANAQQTVHLV